MENITRFWLFLLLATSFSGRLGNSQHYSYDNNAHIFLNKLFPHRLPKYEALEGMDTQEFKDEMQNIMDVNSKSVAKEKRTNTEIEDMRDSSNQNVNDQFEKHMNLVLQHVAKKLREIYITPRLGRDIEDNIECNRSRPPFAPRLGKKSTPLTPRMGRQAYDDKC